MTESQIGVSPILGGGCHGTNKGMDKNAMKKPDKPLFDKDDIRDSPGATVDPAVREHIQHLVAKQPYAVLCVQGQGQPYGALVAFAFSEDLRHAVFVTPVATRKYRLLSDCDHVALVIDNRANKADELMEIEAVTVTGRSQMIERGGEFDRVGRVAGRSPSVSEIVRASPNLCVVSRRCGAFSACRAIPGGQPMDSERLLLISLDAAGEGDEQLVCGKAAKLAQIARAEFEVPRGFCLTTRAYQAFVTDARITAAIRMERGASQRRACRADSSSPARTIVRPNHA